MSPKKTRLKTLGIALALTLCSTGGISVAAYAYKGGNDHGYNHSDNNGDGDSRYYRDNRENRSDRIVVVIDNNDRQAIHGYMQDHKHRHCPPGLQKKHNGCVPPCQLRRYEIGKRLPPDVIYVAVPYSLQRNLRAPQPGYQYVRVDNDVLLMSKTDRTIADAVSLLNDLAQ